MKRLTFTFVTLLFLAEIMLGQSVRESQPQTDVLHQLGYSVTGGPAPGYVEDRACATCHNDLYRSFQELGKARSFSKAGTESVIEDFSRNRGSHKASKRHYEMNLEDEKYQFKRYQLDGDSSHINVIEQEVHWILGSGRNSRHYLYQTESGELFQLPIAYYTQDKIWYMAPGYDRRQNEGIQRRVSRECMFCHNDYPDVAAGTDAYGAPPVFPADLPQGIGCQRCHGPGAAHARVALSSESTVEQKRASIVNPRRLAPKLRDDVCDQCHMQPSAALEAVRRFGRADYSFRPGETLSDYLVQMDPVEEGEERSKRFEINHHSYRLRQSRCYTESAAALNCVTCHDPHSNVPEAKRIEHYRTTCLKCHQPDHFSSAHAQAKPPIDTDDCVACHMPKRRTQDVVHVAMTDHFIRRRPAGEELLAPLKESTPTFKDVEFLDPEQAPKDAEGEVYRAVAVSRAASGTSATAVARLEAALAASQNAKVEPYLDLARGQLKQRQFEAAVRTTTSILESAPDNLLAREWLGIALLAMGNQEAAIEELRRVLKSHPNRAEANYNLGLVLVAKERYEEAVDQFQRAIKARPNMVTAWYYLGYTNAKLKRFSDAVHSYRRTLEIEPSHTRAYLGIGQALLSTGNREEALRYYRHGLKVAGRLAPIARALDEVLALESQDR